MYYVIMKSFDIRQNLATEQYLMNHVSFDEPVVLFYIQKPCVIIGRNQNAFAEVDLAYAKKQQISVTRRLSGGGAVYDDLGNVSFSFVVDAANKSFGNFKLFTKPIIEALHQMGATEAEISGRNDLLIEGKKFSGNAMYTKQKKMYIHGTLMFDVDLNEVDRVLTVSNRKLESKGIKSVKSRVTNIKPYLSKEYQQISTEEFRDKLLLRLFQADSLEEIASKEYHLTSEDQQAIDQLVADIYGNDDWIYGEAPRYKIKKEKKFKGGIIEANIEVRKGRIEGIVIYGDYFSQKDTRVLEGTVLNTLYNQQALEETLSLVNIDEYFSNVSKKEFIQLLIG